MVLHTCFEADAHLTRMLQVVYISDVGAAHHSVFMGLAIPTAVLFFVCIYLDFHLRHIRRIPKRQRGRERAWAAVATFFAFSTMVFCILLTIFDAFNHDNLHWGFAVVFFISLIICGVASLVEIACESWALVIVLEAVSSVVWKNSGTGTMDLRGSSELHQGSVDLQCSSVM